MAKKRIGYFDIAKCIAILFIVVGHTGIIFSDAIPGGMPSIVVHFAFTFHLPVFFVASGYFFRLDTILDENYFRKSFRNLLVPYFVTCGIIVVGCAAMAFFQGTSIRSALFEWTGASLLGYGATSVNAFIPFQRIGGIWFLLALLWAQIILLVVSRLPKPGIWVAAIFVLGCFSSQYVQLPWSIQSGICAAPYVYLGAMAHKYDISNKTGKWANIALVACLAIWLVYIFGPFLVMSFAQFILPDGWFDVVGTFAACYVVFRLCRFIEHHTKNVAKFMEWIGRNALVIFCLHIVEDDVMLPVWAQMISALSVSFPHAGWIVFLLFRLAFDAILCAIVYLIPKLNAVYFPKKRKKLPPKAHYVSSLSKETVR